MKKYDHKLFQQKLEETLTESEKKDLHEAVNPPSLMIGYKPPQVNYKDLHANAILNFLSGQNQLMRNQRETQKEHIQEQIQKGGDKLIQRVKESYNKGFRSLGALTRKIRKAYKESIA